MGKITALEFQKRNRNRVSVFVDGQFQFGVTAVAAQGLKVGQELTPADESRIQREDETESARQAALRLISYRPRSLTEVQRNLKKKGYPQDIIDEVCDRLTAVDLLGDASFAQYWIEQRESFKPRSHHALRLELQQKGISREIIENALSGVDETESARKAARQKAARWTHLNESDFKSKLGRFLQQRGFHFGIIRDVTEETWQDLSEGERDIN